MNNENQNLNGQDPMMGSMPNMAESPAPAMDPAMNNQMPMPDPNMNMGPAPEMPAPSSLMTPMNEAPAQSAPAMNTQMPMGDANMNMGPAPIPELNNAMPTMQPEDAPTMSQMAPEANANAGVPTGEAKGAWTALGFFFPLIGIIVYFACKKKLPSVSKKCGKGALIGIIVNVAVVIIYIVLIVIGVAAIGSSTGGIYY